MPDVIVPETSRIKEIIDSKKMPEVLTPGFVAGEHLTQITPKDLELLMRFPEIMGELWLGTDASSPEGKPIMRLANSDNKLIFKLLLGEIQELLEEHERLGTDGFSPEEIQKEFIDKLIFLGTMGINGAQEPFNEIRYFNHFQLAKLANSSTVYERLSALAADVYETNNRRSFVEFIKVSISLMANFPMEFNLTKAFNAVLEKNRRNYPAEYFQPYDYFTGQELSIEEQILKYFHVRKCLKYLRYYPDGSLIDYHAQFRALIHSFRSSDEAFRQLKEDVERKLIKKPKTQSEVSMIEGSEYQVSNSASGLAVATA